MALVGQIRLIEKTYALAIAILVVLAFTGTVLMNWALLIQRTHVELSLLVSRQAQVFSAVQSATNVFLDAASEPDAVDAGLIRVRERLADQVNRLDGLNREIATFLDTRRGTLNGGVSDTIIAIYRDRPHRLAHWLDTVVKRSKELQIMSPREVRYVVDNWSTVNVALLSGTGLIRSFDNLLAEIERASKAHVTRQETLQAGLTGLTLLVLLGEAVFIFGPMVRRLRRAHLRAEETTADLNRLAFTDSLTGLGNRTFFQRALQDHCAAAPSKGGFALILCDLDRFKAVNDGFGHAAGDALIAEMARRIAGAIRPGDTAARLGGDEFAVIAPGLVAETDLIDLVAHIRAATALPWRWGDVEIDVSSSVGGALTIDGSEDPDRLFAYADMALYEAKTGERHLKIFDGGLRAARDNEAAILRELPRALATGEFELHYQPKIRIADGGLVGVEALVRWRHPDRGLLPPGQFLGAVLRGGRMVDLTRHVIATAAADLEHWRRSGIPVHNVAVNMPESMLASRLGLTALRDAMDRHGLPGHAFTVEITEDVLLSRAAETISEVVNSLSALGVRISFDDFGTGFASLSHLRSFAFDQLKIDRSFVAEIGVATASEQIVRSIVSLARALGKDVVAEGVETERQLRFLAAEGCTVAQGYLYAPALPIGDLEAWIADRYRSRTTDALLRHAIAR
ncbi:putative bifunctional diguanylate cyclase/phosphodiesterase [Mongoliimonas terrestris]|uniref:putative bifunctional diguanylate cyclase/phosphodiesterase n=1 Tax=Mongoliimonas terrestris TaxID=1709001 RepID=UPI0009497A45|nr:EAL domain-containing protein [Mongoliimonas terrestris]